MQIHLKRCIVGVALGVSIAINVFILAPYTPYLVHYFSNTELVDPKVSDDELIDLLVKNSMDSRSASMVIDEYKGFPIDQYNFWTRHDHNQSYFNSFYAAYLYVGLSYYAVNGGRLANSKQDIVMDFLVKKANSWMDQGGVKKLNYDLQVIDQVPIGILYINLYKLSGDNRYLSVVDQIFSFVKNQREDGSNLIKYRKQLHINFIDCLGMIIPFLKEYYMLMGDRLAYEIIRDNILEFQHKCVDAQTHIPFHAYDIQTGLHLGSTNWGRGIGWYLLALSYCKEFNDCTLYDNICKMPYTQFPLYPSGFDSSTAIMFELYKRACGTATSRDISFIRDHIDSNGSVLDCSGDAHGCNDYSHTFAPSGLCNGLLLLMLFRDTDM